MDEFGNKVVKLHKSIQFFAADTTSTEKVPLQILESSRKAKQTLLILVSTTSTLVEVDYKK